MFYVPMVWREQKDHLTDCYFCTTKISGFSKKSKSEIKYPNCVSAIKPVPHSAEYAVSTPPSIVSTFDSETESSVGAGTSSASKFEDTVAEQVSSSSHILTQEDLPNLARDLSLSIEKSEILASRLK